MVVSFANYPVFAPCLSKICSLPREKVFLRIVAKSRLLKAFRFVRNFHSFKMNAGESLGES